MKICYCSLNQKQPSNKYFTNPKFTKIREKLIAKLTLSVYASYMVICHPMMCLANEIENTGLKNSSSIARTLDKIDATGNSAITIVERIGYWLVIFMCLIEILKQIKDGNTRNIWGTILRYASFYGAIFLIKQILDMITDWFSDL